MTTGGHTGLKISVFLILILFLGSCAATAVGPNQVCRGDADDYGRLGTAVRKLASAKVVLYGDQALPPDLTAAELVTKANDGNLLPPAYYNELVAHRLRLRVMENEYLLIVYDPDQGCLIMYDCSCSRNRLDGPVYEQPEAYSPGRFPCACN